MSEHTLLVGAKIIVLKSQYLGKTCEMRRTVEEVVSGAPRKAPLGTSMLLVAWLADALGLSVKRTSFKRRQFSFDL